MRIPFAIERRGEYSGAFKEIMKGIAKGRARNFKVNWEKQI